MPRAVALSISALLAGGLVAAVSDEAATCGDMSSLLQSAQARPCSKASIAPEIRDASKDAERTVHCSESDFVKYVGYDGDLEVHGKVLVTALAGTAPATMRQVLSYHMSGVDPDCSMGPGTTPNSCGIHIHAGTSCEDEAGAGLHYYDSSAVAKDPWGCVAYTSTLDGESVTACSLGVSAKTGVPPEMVPGHTVVVHDYFGVRVACAVIGGAKTSTTSTTTGAPEPAEPASVIPKKAEDGGMVLRATDFVRYVGYNGSLNVTGIAGVWQNLGHCPATKSQYLSYQLSGADPECEKGPGSEKNSCGVHVHEGTSCESGAGPHYYDSSKATDPWCCISYTTYSSAGSALDVGVLASTGVDLKDVEGRTLIVHDFQGARIACAVLK
eukprot:CAMPEP_0176232880 /NCGR_PEP_ID=MMETSP0121_2-20121125/25535_1 /TAXON_ID=160619 /ORGANISM="Kryptoperidinium foliaceum, Strain CCMP 1326" /LENGTH=382 /DNA_ID=CAMNT_0017572253 /DNA_START=64 /DNA_END=1212 /DNA_ORIENTATION=+